MFLKKRRMEKCQNRLSKAMVNERIRTHIFTNDHDGINLAGHITFE